MLSAFKSFGGETEFGTKRLLQIYAEVINFLILRDGFYMPLLRMVVDLSSSDGVFTVGPIGIYCQLIELVRYEEIPSRAFVKEIIGRWLSSSVLNPKWHL